MKSIDSQKEKLNIKTYENRALMGTNAAKLVSERIQALLEKQEKINMIFASAPSQSEFLEALVEDKNIDWSRVNGFHMDEYIGLKSSHPQSFATFLNKYLFNLVPINKVFFIDGETEDAEKECDRYADLLKKYPADIVCMGIGENTHIAFNEPHVADFNDSKLVKIVDLDDKSRQQQVNDGCFEKVEEVPTHAITLTIPALFNGRYLYCMVPDKNKRKAVYHTLTEKISENYPSTILRKHENAILFLDSDSAAELKVYKDE